MMGLSVMAERALARARTRQVEAVVMPLVEPAAPPAPLREADLLPNGHFSRVLYLEGRRAAAELAQSWGNLLHNPEYRRELINKLRRLAEDRPASYAKGMEEIVAILKGAADE